ncbi:MAG: Gfo/Idh/MocA family oxidoreductase, partial [Armatimonadetes bacterium]|nr:Gfo/Idh/MocA family oxidoreductase [Armatimonadota bacterium]
MSSTRLRGVVVGCRGMGRWHAKALHLAQEYDLAAICDLNEPLAQEVAAEYPGTAAYGSLERMLAEVQPDVVAIATPNSSHAELTSRCAAAGVRGICCEKPMAVNLGEARRMTAACRDHGVPLIVHHQRRMLGSLVRMRELLLEGAVGEVQVLRGSCQGDLLTDGTHVVDSLLHLAGDADPMWVFGNLYRTPTTEGEERGMGFKASGGYRYGHPVESGAFGLWEFGDGVRAEVFCGGLHLPGRQYQDYEVLGTAGRLWRTGDRDQPGVLFQKAGSANWTPIDVPPD